jgi:NAD(P)-dependent dehydrogenase (short-subunit alcohol dehydrogenase family)
MPRRVIVTGGSRGLGLGIEDVANAVEFLLGARADSVTGTVLTVDAGSTA